jgi:hypothetical protein
MDIQSKYQTLLDEKERSEKKIKQYEQWDEDESRYEPFRLHVRATVLVAKEPKTSAYTKEGYCQNCFSNKKKSQLQPKPKSLWSYYCHVCDFELTIFPRDQKEYNEANNGPPSAPTRPMR